MKELTKIMYYDFNMDKLGHDWMGYEFYDPNDLSYHHLIVPRRNGGKRTYDNGAILVQKTAHDYLHLIEHYDLDRFKAITNQMIDTNQRRKIMYESLLYINGILNGFEREFSGCKNKKGYELIREEYTRSLGLANDKSVWWVDIEFDDKGNVHTITPELETFGKKLIRKK